MFEDLTLEPLDLQITEDIATPRRESEVTAWVNAIYGCNEKCTYCVVPFTRWDMNSIAGQSQLLHLLRFITILINFFTQRSGAEPQS